MMIPLYWEIENIDCEKFDLFSFQFYKMETKEVEVGSNAQRKWVIPEKKTSFFKLYNMTCFNKKKWILLNHLKSQLFSRPGF